MGNYISSLIFNNVDDLSLEEAYKILQDNEEEKQKEVPKEKQNYVFQNSVSAKTGVITEIRGDTCVIDNLYVCPNTNSDVVIGSKVKFDCFTFEDIVKVTNVEILNEWDKEDSDSLWYNRIFLCQVDKRVDRQLYLTNTDKILDLDKVQLEFLPIVGDWLELNVKCKMSETTFDLAGEILEINHVAPVRSHLKLGRVSMWNVSDGVGVIDNNIFFNQLSLHLGYLPRVGDKVVAQVIESTQMRNSWRAIKVLPEYKKAKSGNIFNTSVDISNFIDNYPGLEVQENEVMFEKLGETKTFDITILNKSGVDLKLINAEFLNKSAQCRILSNIENIILCGEKHDILCEASSKSVGQSKEFFVLDFGDFVLYKYVSVLVSIQHSNQRVKYQKNEYTKPYSNSSNQIIRGQGKPTRFAAKCIPHYPVPKKLIDVTLYSSKVLDAKIQEIGAVKPSITSNLTAVNYEDKFHTLLHLDEIAMLIGMRNYDQERACFIKNGEYLMLEIENLSEQRPSLAVGDKIIATDPMNDKSLQYEGCIHKVAAKHIYLKFSPLFHDKYNGEDYSIRAQHSRSTYKSLHHAIYLAARNLGPELLFPNRIIEKDRQIEFIQKDELSPIKNSSKMNSILSKMKEYKNYSNLNCELNNSQNQNTGTIILEWFNKNLNNIQKNAVKHILWGTTRPFPYIIFGPPGTGKTVTLVESVLQLIRMFPSSRLLVTAPSNSAADLLAMRLINSEILLPGDLVRVVSYNYALRDSIPDKLIPYCATTSLAKEDTVLSASNNSNGIKFNCNQSTLGRSRITVTTCSTAGQFVLMNFTRGHFTHIIVDEAAQAEEPDVMIPLSFIDKSAGQIILAGDPLQLGPVIMCKIAAECGLNESYLERIMNRFPYVRDPEGFPETSGFDPRFVTKLLYNYRALPDILTLYGSLFYHNELIPVLDDESSKEADLLNSLQEILPNKRDKPVRIVFHGVIGENYQTADSPSWYNPHEIAQVFYYVNQFYRLGVKSSSVGIITPYVKQAKELRSILTEAEFELPKIGTVEEFQGQEFDITILSTVRSSEDYLVSDITHNLGFIACPKRLNVAVSRAKSLLLVIGNPKLLCRDPYWRSVVEYCIEYGAYKGCDFE